MKCHYPDKDVGRVRLFAFNWVSGGYNQVYARDVKDAVQLANESFGAGTAKLVVNERTVRVVDPDTYWSNMPHFD